jgi:TrmH family RNA methyltransferase
MKIKAYKKDFDYTYTLGVFETIELLKNRPDLVLRVYIKSNSYKNKGIPIIDEICREKHIELIESDNTIQKLSKKDNCFAIAIIKKYEMTLQEGNHVVLVNPGDMGNMGTIIRLADWYGIENIFCSLGCADIYNPKTVQATMGALARVKVCYVDLRDLFETVKIPVYGTFLNGEDIYKSELTSHGIIVMGNEGKGISENLERCISKRLFIPNYPQGRETTESLNVAIATAIVCAEFRRRMR